MKITKRTLKRMIREEKAKIQESPKRAKLRRLIREEAEAGGGAPNVDDIARKVSSLGAEGAIQWIGDLLAKLDVAGGAPEPAPPPPPVEEIGPDEPMPEGKTISRNQILRLVREAIK